MKKTFYEVRVEVSRNIGNITYKQLFKTLGEAKEYAEKINSYYDNEHIILRDSHVLKITRHAFAENATQFNNEKMQELEDAYFSQHGEFAY